MQIENSGINQISSAKSENIHQVSNTAYQSKAAETSTQKDTANLSVEGRLLSKAYSAFSENDGVVREDLVNSIKQKIEEGSYSIPTQQLASALMKIIEY